MLSIVYATQVYILRSSGVRAKYSLSMSPSIRFLITTGLGRNRARNCCVTCEHKKHSNTYYTFRFYCHCTCITIISFKCDIGSYNIAINVLNVLTQVSVKLTSATRTLCCIFFLDFIMRTIAASISCFLSSSTFCRVSFLSGSDSPCLAATAEIKGLNLFNKTFYIDNTRKQEFETCIFHTRLDLHTVQFGSKLIIDCKHMPILYFLGFRFFSKNSLSGLSTGQRLQCSHKFPLWDVCLLLYLLY